MKAATNEIDLALTEMCIKAKRDETLTVYAIADLCGCTPSYIGQIERKAINKLRESDLLAFIWLDT